MTNLRKVIGIVLLALPLACLADTTLVYSRAGQASKGQSTVMVKDGQLRMQSHGGNWMLYDRGKGELYVVDPAREAYSVINEQSVSKVHAAAQRMREKYREQLKKLSPEQRQAMEKRFANLLEDHSDEPPLSFQPSGQSGTVAGYSCRKGEVKRSGKAVESICVAAPNTLGMSDGEFSTFKSLFHLMARLSRASGIGEQKIPDLETINGVPLEIDEPAHSQQKLIKVEHKSLSQDQFQLPKGYRRSTGGL